MHFLPDGGRRSLADFDTRNRDVIFAH